VEVSDANHLKSIISALKKIKKVIKVERIKGGAQAEGVS